MSQNDAFGQLKPKRKRTGLRIMVVILLLILIIGGAGYFYIKDAFEPMDPGSSKKVTVVIPPGSSVAKIGQILEKNDLIQRGLLFRIYAKWHHEAGFKAGTYLLSPSMSMQEMMNDLESGKQSPAIVLSIPEGFWVKDIAHRIAQKTSLNEADILNKMKDRQYIKTHYMSHYDFLKPVILNSSIIYPLEGYLFPATYQFYKKDPSLDDIINKMLSKMDKVISHHEKAISSNPLHSLHDVLTMASLLEDEASTTEARKKIAGVFYNRLNKGMPLQTDPTVAYAKQKHLYRTYYKDLKIQSPYNTYQNKGLPVGPINNPGESAIIAALNPVQTDALYFYARPNGEIIFSKTYAEHESVVNKYKDEWKKARKK